MRSNIVVFGLIGVLSLPAIYAFAQLPPPQKQKQKREGLPGELKPGSKAKSPQKQAADCDQRLTAFETCKDSPRFQDKNDNCRVERDALHAGLCPTERKCHEGAIYNQLMCPDRRTVHARMVCRNAKIVRENVIDEAECPAQAQQAEAPPPPALPPVPFFDSILLPEERVGLSEKYRSIFTSDKLLRAIQNDQFVSFPEWPVEDQRKLLLAIVFYEGNGGAAAPPFAGDCSLEGNDNSCFTTVRGIVSETRLNPALADHIRTTQIAWNLYVEANRLVPWSILNYSEENLRILFYSTVAQPRLRTQRFGLLLNPVENFQIVRDQLGENALVTLLNSLQFVGERVTHFTGARNDIGPDSATWPYPFLRMPTPKEILIDRNPHHNLLQNPNALVGPRYHIALGCWGVSQLLKALLTSVNLPVFLVGDYSGFGGHSGANFLEIEGHTYYLEHGDDIHHLPWTMGLIRQRGILPSLENWGIENFFPFQECVSGYSVLHAENPPRNHQATLEMLSLPPDQLAIFGQQLGQNFGENLFDFSQRVLAVRSMAAPSALTLFGRCEEADVNRRHLPMTFLTDAEELAFSQILDQEILRRRQVAGNNNISCFDLLFNELNDLYQKKTGLELRGNEDGDGFENFRDCNIYQMDPAPCNKAFYTPLGIPLSG